MPKKPLHPVTQYARDVVDGFVLVGKPVMYACERHLADLKKGKRRGIRFDEKAADRAIKFMGLLHHFEGPLAGQPWKLEPWQVFVVGSIFGWKRKDGTRRFREAWVEVARKNGKSFMGAAIGLYLLICDREAGAQVYTAATKKEQARIIHRAALAMRDKSPWIRQKVDKLKDRLMFGLCFFAPLGKDSKTEDGLNPHGAILDEVHAWRDGDMWDVLESGQGARRQPLICATTTAGKDIGSFGRLQHDYYLRVVDPESGVDADAAFVYIAQLDLAETEDEEGDDPYDEGVWQKANPNLGVSVFPQYMRDRAKKAKDMPRVEADFLVKNLNVWIQGGMRWMSSAKWDACGAEIDLASLRTRPCFGGLDLSSTTDLTAFALFFPATHTKPAVLLVWFFVPSENVEKRARVDRVDYRGWINDGWIEATDGDMVDQNRIKAAILEKRQQFPALQAIAIDMKFGIKLAGELGELGFEVLRFNQGFASYCAPTKQLEVMVGAKGIIHRKNPVLRWNIGNVVLKTSSDNDDDVMPSKARSVDRIDGVAAGLMAIGIAASQPIITPQLPKHAKLSARRGRSARTIHNVFR